METHFGRVKLDQLGASPSKNPYNGRTLSLPVSLANLSLMSWLAGSASGGSLTITAIISGLAALIGPSLALGRWIQERSVKHRCREEMEHSVALLAFIQKCPEILSVVGVPESPVRERTRAELTRSFSHIGVLLEKNAAKGSPPVEMAWPRKFLLLYAPRSWGAIFLHAIYNLLTVLGLSAIIEVFNDETDILSAVPNPWLVVTTVSWLFFFWLLWYVTTTKDRWDKTLPPEAARPQAHFLRVTPLSARELLARVTLAYGLYALVALLVVRGRVEAALWSDPLIASMLNLIPGQRIWGEILDIAATIVGPILAFLWAKAEFGSYGRRNWLPFPHNLRVLYRASEWQELFAQASFVIFSVYLALMLFRMHEILPIAARLLQREDTPFTGAFFAGASFGSVLQPILVSAISIYGSYRLGLIRYLSHREAQAQRPDWSSP
jgi:hypothetical protein